MNKLLAICLILLATSCTTQNVPSEKGLVAAINEFNQVYESGAADKLASMITDNYVHTNAAWKSFGKETWLGYMKKRSNQINNGTLVIESYEMDELWIEMHDDAAIVTARISSSGIEDGVRFDKKFRVSNLWIYDGSRWLRAAFHDTIIE
ncbi:nuclear transport factor 2 family protein [Ekhidna sp.]|uniref:nuclear transport factor 2 family protein n=1 Tax=Ekhidna sp. TaxID=2608089 RepID=UPI003C7CE29A